MWVDAEYYETEYLLGRQPAIPLSEFVYWEQAARVEINRNKVEIVEAPDELKQCVCEVAEALHEQSKASSLDRVKSFSNDGYSVAYAADSKTPDDLARTIRAIVAKHLAGTELHNQFVFAGVR